MSTLHRPPVGVLWLGWALCLLGSAVAAEAQRSTESFSLKAGDLLRVHADPERERASHLFEGEFWLVDPDLGLLLRAPGNRKVYVPRHIVREVERWERADGASRIVWIAVAAGAVLGSIQGAQFPSEGDFPLGLTLLAAGGGAGLGWVVGSAVTSGDGSWRPLPIYVVFGPENGVDRPR